ncbi:hypothetical protein HAX54_022153 [Datura stramonium]|uniref:Uncharacterized protein n=1 Tax=Datura stramonium TaxID=4076 RepID=A0ABS8UW64_DATST|nr:hypothetical protein [Datura stramonium]
MANREEEEATFQGDNQGNEPQKKSKSSRRDKSRGRDPFLVPVSEGLTHEETEGKMGRDSMATPLGFGDGEIRRRREKEGRRIAVAGGGGVLVFRRWLGLFTGVHGGREEEEEEGGRQLLFGEEGDEE